MSYSLSPNNNKNYAYDISANSHHNDKSIKEYGKIQKNFYEELLSADKNIKNWKKKLTQLKNDVIKETVYTNKRIPKFWRTKLDYNESVYSVIDSDDTFAKYIGKGNHSNDDDEQLQMKKLKTEYSNFSTKDGANLSNFKQLEKRNSVSANKENDYVNTNNTNYTNMNNTANSFNPHENARPSRLPFLPYGHPPPVDEKFVMLKLDELRSNFDMAKLMEGIREKRRRLGLDDNRKVEENNDWDTDNKKKEGDFREMRRIKQLSDKGSVLKKTIYSNLLRKDENEKELREQMRKKILEKKKKKSLLKPEKSGPIFLHSYTEFDTPVEIRNQKIKRDLTIINFYGPLYKNCQVCGRRNMEFYKNGEERQTEILLKFLKKYKYKIGQETGIGK